MSFVAALLRIIFHATILTPFESPLRSFFGALGVAFEIEKIVNAVIVALKFLETGIFTWMQYVC
jgi:hypothetical protein